MSHIAYVGLGSNIEDRRAYLRAAVTALKAADGIAAIQASRVYETLPAGEAGPGLFLNAALRVTTSCSPAELLGLLRQIEEQLGRGMDRSGPRTIDLDILLYNSRIVASETLTIPHPRLHERAFVLLPLAELAADEEHPLLGRTIAELTQAHSGSPEIVACLGDFDSVCPVPAV